MKIKPLDPTVISSCEEFNLDSTTVALSGGEDYELLFTVKQEDFLRLRQTKVFSLLAMFYRKVRYTSSFTRVMSVIKAMGGTVLKISCSNTHSFTSQLT
jgi:thiamine-monophosphate kinase